MQSVFTGFWLGILSPSDLDSVDDAHYVGVGGKRAGPIDYASTAYNKRGSSNGSGGQSRRTSASAGQLR
jgi:hypothetical protein